MTDRVRVAIIGCGGIARGHVDRLLTIPGVEIAALVEPNPANLERLRVCFPPLRDTPGFTEYEEALDKVEVDAVQINSPHNVHYEQIMAALSRGLHVLVEKPMVCTTKHAVDIVKKQRETGLVASISYQRHTQGVFQYIKQSIEKGVLGDVQYIAALQGQDWLRGCRGTWRHKKEISCGGQLNDSGSHLIDIILYATGLKAAEVSAFIENFDAEVDINSTTSVRFRNGALGSISIIGNCPRWYEDITVVGSEGVFLVRGGELTWDNRREIHRIGDFRYGSTSADQNFIAAIHGKEEVLAPSVCGLRTIELTEAIWKSAEAGGPVKVEEQGV
ncbi:MAG TPA: Gfo/Idh/MocA family oxidoreductase [Planctomycetes bacterium]|nr:Gfo/Idh/MocA family oxidoreductase [Planctomycetota bacterium]